MDKYQEEQLFRDYGKGKGEIRQNRGPQSLGAELQDRANTAEIEGDDSHDIVGKGLNVMLSLFGQRRDQRSEQEKLDQMAADYRRSMSGEVYIPPEDKEEYRQAYEDLLRQQAMQAAMGTAGGLEPKSPFSKPTNPWQRPRITGEKPPTRPPVAEGEGELNPYVVNPEKHPFKKGDVEWLDKYQAEVQRKQNKRAEDYKMQQHESQPLIPYKPKPKQP